MKIFVILFLVAATVCGCPNKKMLNVRQRGFIAHHSEANFFDANRFCRSICMELVSVETYDQYLKLSDILKGIDGTFWISGTKSELDNFYWFSTVTPISFTTENNEISSDASYVKNDETKCLVIEKNGENVTLKAASCFEEHNFICLNDGF